MKPSQRTGTENGRSVTAVDWESVSLCDDREQLLEAVLRGASRLVADSVRQPSTLRIAVGEVSVELSWAQPPVSPAPVEAVPSEALPTGAGLTAPAGTPAPAATGPSTGTPAPAATDQCICAPTVGAFYHAPEPGAPPFVRVGDVVREGQQVGLLEAMKLMIPVYADRAGTVLEVLRPDGTAVEYGEPLIAVGAVER